MTDKGWKVSFHLVYPYLTFPCNNTLLKDAATALSNLSSLCFCDGDGTTCRFVDTAVYTRNRQFRLPLNHKLSDATCSVLRLPGCPTASTFRLACVTCLEQEAWRVPESTSPPLPTTSLAVRTMSGAGYATRTSLSVPNEVRTAESGILSSLFALLRNAGQTDGRLQAKEGDACTFRWTTFSPRPCCVAQLWRPANPSHDTNGAYVTYDRSHAVFLKCLHPQCLRFGGRGEFLGYLAPVSSTTTTENDTAPMSAFQRGQKRRLEASPKTGKRFTVERSLSSESCPQPPTLTNAAAGDDSDPSLSAVLPLPNQDIMSPVTNLSAQSNNSTAQLTLKQGLTRIFARNQENDDRPLTAWHVDTGDCGGRLGALCSTIQSTSACTSSHQNSGKDASELV